jgi:Flp pilus assembly protein TadD
MSLINQMLKDLERRSRSFSQTEMSMSGLQISTLKKHKDTRYIHWLIIISILFAVMVTILFSLKEYNSHKKNVHSQFTLLKLPLIVDQQSTLDKPVSSYDLHAAASVITGLTLQTQKETTLLRILLSQDTLYRVSMNSKKQYVIVFEHAQLVTNLPSINTSNSAIEDIRMLNQRDGDLYLVLLLKKGAELNHLELNTDGKYPEFQMDMTYKDNHYLDNQISQEKDLTFAKSLGQLKKSMISIGPFEEYQQAIQYANQGSTKKAIVILTNLVEKFPDYPLARESLVKLLLTEGKNIQAKNIIQIGLQKHPFYPPYAELKARILVSEGQVTDAIQLLQQSAPSINKNPEYHAFIAALYQRQGQSLLAAKLYEQLLPLEPENSVWWMGLGIAYEDLGKRNEAIQAYLRADNTDKLNPELKAYVESRMHSLQ